MIDFLAAVQNNAKILGGFRYPIVAGLIAAFVAWILTPYVRNLAIRQGAIDDPKSDDRRVHKEPTPRWGGLAIYAGLVVALGLVLPFAYPRTTPFPPYLIGMLLIGGAIVAVGALDDLYQYKARIQMLFLLGAGIAIQFFHGPLGTVQMRTIGIPFTEGKFIDLTAWSIHLGSVTIPSVWFLAVPLTAIYIFVVTKTMDTIDGIDGLAAGIAAIAAATLTILAAYGQQPRVALVAAAIAGSAIGFLKHNYNPAKIFMGTGGAQLLGFMLACLSIVGAFKTAAAFALIVPVLVFGVPIFDAVFVVVRRIASRQPITQADKRHLHHTLLGKGLSQRQAVLVLYLAAAALCAVLLMVIRNYG